MTTDKNKIVWSRAPRFYGELRDVIGDDATVAIATYLGGTYQYFPKLESLTMGARDNGIRALFNAGDDKAMLAERYGLTERRIRQILSEG